MVPGSWSLVRERALTTGLCSERWHCEHSGVIRPHLPVRAVVLQWIAYLPAATNLAMRPHRDTLAKKGTTKGQENRSTTFQVTKTITKATQHSKCMAAATSMLQQIRPLATICCQDQRRCLSVAGPQPSETPPLYKFWNCSAI